MKLLVYFGILVSLITMAGCSESDPDHVKSKSDPDALEQNAAIFQYDSGISIGARAPLDVAVISDNETTNLGEVLEAGPIVLFFIRSVEWCGFCQAQLKTAEQVIPELGARGYRAFAVSYDKPSIQAKFLADQSLSIKTLSDETSSLIDAFELRDPQFTEGRAAGVPYATIMVIGKSGRILNKTVSGNHTSRPSNEQILNLVDAI